MTIQTINLIFVALSLLALDAHADHSQVAPTSSNNIHPGLSDHDVITLSIGEVRRVRDFVQLVSIFSSTMTTINSPERVDLHNCLGGLSYSLSNVATSFHRLRAPANMKTRAQDVNSLKEMVGHIERLDNFCNDALNGVDSLIVQMLEKKLEDLSTLAYNAASRISRDTHLPSDPAFN
ncbi:hypothetical protein CJ030_MR3G009515 [Morella rubra]|uniref:Pectinesterase inhibitor domain-containing protein n=1 Tax=Morella rubra TaxID=262757 RepID=A0A6A1W4N1_9ROSI|nr:hypothetical protein CJ030_MR3G009515 [Morella rubra]